MLDNLEWSKVPPALECPAARGVVPNLKGGAKVTGDTLQRLLKLSIKKIWIYYRTMEGISEISDIDSQLSKEGRERGKEGHKYLISALLPKISTHKFENIIIILL